MNSFAALLGLAAGASVWGDSFNVCLPPWNSSSTQQNYTLQLSNLAQIITVTRYPCFVELKEAQFRPTNTAVQIPLIIDLKKAENPFRLEIAQNGGGRLLSYHLYLTLLPDKHILETDGSRFTLKNISDEPLEIVSVTGGIEIAEKSPRMIKGTSRKGGVIQLRGRVPVRFEK